MDGNGYMVYPLTLLKRGRERTIPTRPCGPRGLTSPCLVQRKSSSSRTERRNGSTDPRSPHWLKVDAYEEWEHFFMCYPWAFRRPADESVLLPFERDYFESKKMRQRR